MESKFTKEELEQINKNLERINTHIPNDLASWVWSTYKNITGSSEKQPCTCGSAGKHWKKAVDAIREYVS